MTREEIKEKLKRLFNELLIATKKVDVLAVINISDEIRKCEDKLVVVK